MAVVVRIILAPSNLAEYPPVKPLLTSDQRLIVLTPDHLERAFNRAVFDLSAILTGQADVPHLLLKKWPEGFADMQNADRKNHFSFKRSYP